MPSKKIATKTTMSEEYYGANLSVQWVMGDPKYKIYILEEGLHSPK